MKALSFSADGRHLVTADTGGTIRVFLLDESQLFQLARDRISAPLTDEQCSLYLDQATCPSDVSAFGKVADSNALARAGDTAAAETKYREALLQEPGLGAHPALITRKTAASTSESSGPEAARASFTMAMHLVRGGRVHDGVLALSNAERLDPTLQPSASELNSFCWSGALWGRASEVIQLCTQAVDEDPDNSSIRDSKALAEAELGQLNHAATDFSPLRFERVRTANSVASGYNNCMVASAPLLRMCSPGCEQTTTRLWEISRGAVGYSVNTLPTLRF